MVESQDGEQERKAVRSTFTTSNIFKCLRDVNSQLCSDAELLYERTMDMGGHPTPVRSSRAWMSSEATTRCVFTSLM